MVTSGRHKFRSGAAQPTTHELRTTSMWLSCKCSWEKKMVQAKKPGTPKTVHQSLTWFSQQHFQSPKKELIVMYRPGLVERNNFPEKPTTVE